MTGKTIIIIREKPVEGVVNDLSMFATVAGLIGLGVWLSSTAMQWAGFLAAVLLLLTKASGSNRRNTMTIAEARARLDEIEAATRPNTQTEQERP